MESISVSPEENAVFIGNLRKDCPKKDVADSLYDLFSKKLQIALKRSDIQIKGGGKFRHAFIYVQSKDVLQYAIDHLDTREKRTRLHFGFYAIVEQNIELKVGVKWSDKPKKNKTRKDKSRHNQVITEPVKENQIQPINNTPPSLNNALVVRKHLQYQNHGLQAGKEEKFYTEGETLGNETRDREFKEGGGEHYVKKNLKDHVAKYICGFLNSSQEGTLFIGVKDSGNVIGIECDQKSEDNIRLKIDQTIKSILPAIFPQSYHVKFVPVYYNSEEVKENYKVIEISVERVESPGNLYEAAGEVYVRRDGSVQGPLKPSEIQEWSKQFHQKELRKELERQKKENDNHVEAEKYKVVKDKDLEIRKISEEKDIEIHTLRKQVEEVKHENHHLKNKKSKICVIQ